MELASWTEEVDSGKKSKPRPGTCIEIRKTSEGQLAAGPSTSAQFQQQQSKRKTSLINGGSSVNDTSTSGTGTSSSWIEQIQFKAQYNHYRTNNYASVINSSSSLDKVLDSAKILGDERMRGDERNTSPKGERNSLCWHFPRVKLRQIFNAKSLDDILGRSGGNLKTTTTKTKKGKTSAGSISSNSHSSLSSITSGQGELATRPQIPYQCEITPPSPKINLSTSSSDNNYRTSTKTFLAVPNQRGKGNKSRSRSKSKHSHSSRRVSGTKSEDCINRVTPLKKSEVSICQRALGVPCTSNSVGELDVLESVCVVTAATTTSPENQHSSGPPKKHLRFLNRVTPLYSPNDNEMGKISGLDQPRLVVASVSFLQRPVSPLPASFLLPSPAEDPISGKISPMVFNSGSCKPISSFSNNEEGKVIVGRASDGHNNLEDETPRDSQDNNASFRLHQSDGANPERINYTNCCGFVSDGKNAGNNKTAQTRVQAQGKSTTTNREQRSHSGSLPPSSFNQTGSSSNNNQNRHLTETERTTELRLVEGGISESSGQKAMGDLQSPTYVKRTAHMFNARYATTSTQNGSSVSEEKFIPSYLKVSKSLSGYHHGLSYHGSNGHHQSSNGATTPGRVGQSFQPSNLKSPSTTNGTNNIYSHNNGSSHTIESDLSLKYKSSTHTYEGDGPPPLPKTAPPLCSPALVSGKQATSYQEEVSVSREKSPLIRNTIERLCGSSEVMSSWRRTTTTTLTNPDPQRAQEKIIPIRYEDEDMRRDVKIKSCPGKHNLLKDSGLEKSSSISSSTEENANVPTDLHDVVSVDDVDGENSRAIPVHRNGNFKDWYDIGSKINLEETGESGLVLFESSARVPTKIDSETTLASQTTSAEEIKMAENYPAAHPVKTSKRLPLTEVLDKENVEDKRLSKSSRGKEILVLEGDVAGAGVSVEKNGDYFLVEMNKEKERLDERVATASNQLTKLDSSSEEAGKIRAAIGKANLLCTKKFKQFRELCQTNLEENSRGASSTEPFTTKNEDLEGFWDMVLIQVGQVHCMFEDVDPNHKPKPGSVASAPKVPLSRRSDESKSRPTTSKPKSDSSAAAARDESRRKLLAEKRRAMKNQAGGVPQSEAEVHIFAPGSSN